MKFIEFLKEVAAVKAAPRGCVEFTLRNGVTYISPDKLCHEFLAAWTRR